MIKAASKISTAPAIGKVYHEATAPTTDRVIKICSGPYATEDNASEDKIAKPLNLVIFSSFKSLFSLVYRSKVF